ncbi:MAG: alpha/beta fold hydrolase [Novosphingobium sp.]|nr:alpha/beta fold hydrolase [Novosphingobium sp.]
MPHTFILIHGGFHGGWCWERVVPLLEAAGHRALAPDLPGMGSDMTPHDGITLASHADCVADMLRAEAGPVVLVGHSMGGMVVGEAAERVPECIAGLVFVTAAMRLAESPAGSIGSVPPMTVSEDGLSMIGDPAVAPGFFYNTTDPALVEAAIARLRPQPIATMMAPLTTTRERFGALPRSFVECTLDHAIPHEFQRAMQEDLPCDPVFTLETDHSPFFCAPDRLVECLLESAESFAG